MQSLLLLIHDFGSIDHSDLLIQLRKLFLPPFLLHVRLLPLKTLLILLVLILLYVLSYDLVYLLVF